MKMLRYLCVALLCCVSYASYGQGTVVYTSNPAIAKGLRWQGAYSSATSYSFGDVVTYSSSVYVSTLAGTANNTNATPGVSSNWTVLGGGVGGATLQTNGTANTLQTLLNLKNGTGITLSSDGVGGVTIVSTEPAAGTVATNLSTEVSARTAITNALGTAANKNVAGAGVAVPTGPNTTISGDIVTYTGNAGQQQDSGKLLSSLATFAFPSDIGTLAHYDFHDGTGTTVSDISGATACSGAACNFTLTSGTPTGTTAPKWVTGSGGTGVGLAVGNSPSGLYGLGTTNVGTSCQTLPILQNRVQSIAFQAYNPPAMEPYSTTWTQPYILGSATNSGFAYLWNSPGLWIQGWSGGAFAGNTAVGSDSTIGLHDYFISEPTSGNVAVYLDGVLLTNYSTGPYNGSLSTTTGAFSLGCNNSFPAYNNNTNVTSEYVITDLTFGSLPGNAADAAQYHAAVTNQLSTTRAYIFNVNPIQGGLNQLVKVGDSTTVGINTTSTVTQYPSTYCLGTGVTSCYGSSYTTAIPSVGGIGWKVNWYGQPGFGIGNFPNQAVYRECKTYGESNNLHVAMVWIGINGINANNPSQDSWAAQARKCGWDPWVETLYSLNNTAAGDQTNRDPYNNTLVTQAGPGNYHVMNIAEDGLIGKDGVNGTTTGWCGSGGVHLCATGYAYVASIESRVFGNYYGATPNVYTTYSAAGTNNGNDRYVIYNTASASFARTLPDCIGMGGSNIPYKFIVQGSNSVTLSPATVTNQIEQLNGGTSGVAFSAGTYSLGVFTLNTSTSAGGGCNWQVVP